MLYLIGFAIILGIIFYFFSSNVSPIPYFPTNNKDLKKIIDGMDLQNNQVIFDLGAGCGTVIFAAADTAHAKGLNTHFVAVDINVILTAAMWIRKQFHAHKKYIHIVHRDMFLIPYGKLIRQWVRKPVKAGQVVFYIYISPWFTAPVWEMVKHLSIPARIVSYFYPVEGAEEQKKIPGVHTIYLYEITK